MRCFRFFRRLASSLFVVVAVASFTGCPDTSHLRPVPDYENMTDSGEEPSEQQ